MSHPQRLIHLGMLACLVGLGYAARADAPRVIHVAPMGDDAGDGSTARPLRSPHAALDQLKALPRPLTQPVAVEFAAGTYRIDRPLLITPEMAGDERFNVTLRAAPGAEVILSGGVLIEGWTDGGEGLARAEVPAAREGAWAFRELFVHGSRRPRARHPNLLPGDKPQYLRVVQALPDRRTGFTFNPGELAAARVSPGAELVFLHDWSTSRVTVRGVDDADSTLRVRDPIGCRPPHYAIDHFEKHARYWVENSRGLLDAPGEWWLDERAGVLWYRPLPGEPLAQLRVEAPRASGLLRAMGRADRPLRGLVLEGLTLEYSAWALPPQGYAEGQATFHERRDDSTQAHLRFFVPAAVEFVAAEGCVITRCTLRRLGGAGLHFGHAAKGNTLERSLIQDVSGNGVMVGEAQARASDGQAWWSSRPHEAAAGNTVRANVIERCGQQFFGAVGLWVGLARDTRIHHNTLRHHPYTGVSVGWVWNPTPSPCKGNVVEFNHIHDVMQVLSDGGGIYTLGLQPGSILRGNLIHGVPINAGRAESNGIFMDEGSTDLLVENNVIFDTHRSSIRFHQAGRNLLRGNTLVTPHGVPALRFNSTDPRLIEQQSDRALEAGGWSADDARRAAASVGPEAWRGP